MSSLLQRCATVFLRSHGRTSTVEVSFLSRSHVACVSKSSRNKAKTLAKHGVSRLEGNIATMLSETSYQRHLFRAKHLARGHLINFCRLYCASVRRATHAVKDARRCDGAGQREDTCAKVLLFVTSAAMHRLKVWSLSWSPSTWEMDMANNRMARTLTIRRASLRKQERAGFSRGNSGTAGCFSGCAGGPHLCNW